MRAIIEGGIPKALKEAVVKSFLRKSIFDSTELHNYRPVSNIPVLSILLEDMLAEKLQQFLEETDSPDPFQYGFRPEVSP